MLEARNDNNNGNTSIATQEPLWIPTSFQYLTGNLNTGYVVVDSLGNEFTYLPESDEWISRYEISEGENGMPMSLPYMPAWVRISYEKVKNEILGKFGKGGNCNYTVDLIDKWENEIVKFIATKIDRKLVYEDSGPIGAYYDTDKEINTGSEPQYMIYNISDLAGNHWCITNEEDRGYIAISGGSWVDYGDKTPLAACAITLPFATCRTVGFRIVLRKKES